MLNSNVGLIILVAGVVLVAALFFVGGGDKSNSTGGRVVTTMGSPSPAGSGGDNEESWLVAHNTIREKAWGNPVDLEWSPELAAQAKEYAESMAGSGIFAHSNTTNSQICDPDKNYKCGENLSKDFGISVAVTPMETVQRWYNECEEYPGSYTSSSGHYTQVVWKNAKQVGCAYGTNNLGEQYGVCLYDTGNININGSGFDIYVPEVGSCNAES